MSFLMYRYRLNENICPDCFSPLKWVYDGMYWIPCDTEPVLFYPDSGKDWIVYKGRLLKNAKIFRKGLKIDKPVLSGLKPHAFNCRKVEL